MFLFSILNIEFSHGHVFFRSCGSAVTGVCEEGRVCPPCDPLKGAKCESRTDVFYILVVYP